MAEGTGDPVDTAHKESDRRSTVLFAAFGIIAVLLVTGFGWYQFAHRAAAPLDMVQTHPVHGTDTNVREKVLDFVQGKGIKVVNEGFKPTWGAEETAKDVWVVSYVFEVGRESHWLSWKVYPKTGKVVPLDSLARELWNGR